MSVNLEAPNKKADKAAFKNRFRKSGDQEEPEKTKKSKEMKMIKGITCHK